jgi:pSer/pThr/pTyr-binding forkhead associated (FHA) protein
VIVCPRCNKENQDHYKFCLGCGTELPRSALQASRAFTAPTPPRGIPQPGKLTGGPSLTTPESVPRTTDAPSEKQIQFARTQVRGTEPTEPPGSICEPGGAVPPEVGLPKPASDQTACPSCGNTVPLDFKFCGTCGYKMGAPAAAGVRPAEKPVAKPASAKATAPAAPPPPTVSARKAALVLINPDGSEGASFALQSEKTPIGRDTGAPFVGDVYLSPVHATFTFKGDKLFVTDNGSLNGIYIKLERQSPHSLEDGSIFRIGQEILKYEALAAPKEVNGVELMGSPNPGYLGRICTVIGPNSCSDAFAILPDGMHIGRERGDITFPDDGYVSGLHCRIHKEGGQLLITDVGSSNGTFLRIHGEREVRNGELLLIGQQLFSIRY